MSDNRALPDCVAFNPQTGRYERAIPEPFYWGPFPWAWRRLTGWRDEEGRPAQMLNPIREFLIDLRD